MVNVMSPRELMEQFSKLDKENSICEIFIPGKGKFMIILQEEDDPSIESEAKLDSDLRKMIYESRKAYKKKESMTTTELINSLSPEDFTND